MTHHHTHLRGWNVLDARDTRYLVDTFFVVPDQRPGYTVANAQAPACLIYTSEYIYIRRPKMMLRLY